MCLLEVQNLRVKFHNQTIMKEAVKGISFTVEKGRILGLVGESGSGKSSAMLALSGLLPEKSRITADKIRIGEFDLTPPGTEKDKRKAYEQKMRIVRGNEIAMIFQYSMSCLDSAVKIGKQITETIRVHRRCTEAEAKEEAVELLDMVGIRHPEKRMGQYPFELSGGMRQRIVIAIALACQPKLLIADEPTTALDVTVQGQILSILKRIVRETDTAVILVSHDLGVIASACDSVMVMKDGEIVEKGSAEDIFYESVHPYTKALLQNAKRMRKMSSESRKKEILLTLDHVTMSYEKKKIWRRQETRETVEDLSFFIRCGETVGLVGESGCGKTTLARLITGLLKPEKGQMYYRGEEIISHSYRERSKWAQRIQMVFQNPYASLNPRMNVGELLEDVLKVNGISDKEKRKTSVQEVLERVGLSSEDVKKYPGEFSGGQRQRIGIARALILEPELIVLDEAVSALDLTIQTQIIELLKEIQREKQTAYLFISHDLNAVRHISHRVGVMYQGRILEMGDTGDICKEPWHPYTKALLSASLTPDPLKARKKKVVIWADENQKTGKEGCTYADRCGYAMECCYKEQPGNYRYGSREISCFLYSDKIGGARRADYEMTVQI